MYLKFKRLHKDAKLPVRSTDGSAGLDLFLVDRFEFSFVNGIISNLSNCNVATGMDPSYRHIIRVPLGFSMEIPEGHFGFINPRSSRPLFDMEMTGIIDSDYRGEVSLQIRMDISCAGYEAFHYGERHQKIAQMLILPCPRFHPVWVDELSETSRGEGGFGSTGK